ncbi:hypothetical protein [Nocardia transvalensis]|uniref:hypothetical protein n=1 Tax=Nocardia transvalensis TaxID=37333 RepID=UPI001895DA31|nr:hypothetical protein [Nocardia transvalensis]MBF6327882.1 hypothetical protein [Nocardia transvalensis]
MNRSYSVGLSTRRLIPQEIDVRLELRDHTQLLDKSLGFLVESLHTGLPKESLAS